MCVFSMCSMFLCGSFFFKPGHYRNARRIKTRLISFIFDSSFMISVPSINNLMRLVFIFSLLFFSSISFSQSPADLKKFSPLLQKDWALKNKEQVCRFVVAVNDENAFNKFLDERKTI